MAAYIVLFGMFVLLVHLVVGDGPWSADEVLQEPSSSDDRHCRFQSSNGVELDTVTVGSRLDVSYLEPCLSLIGIRSHVGHIQHSSNPWDNSVKAFERQKARQNIESLC